MIKISKFTISVFVIWLFTISGVLGILSSYQEWFLQNTPLNLYVYFFLVVINLKTHDTNFMYAFLIPFILGLISEGLGVNYGYIFGEYSYGENLGYKVWGVPLTICFNWVILTVTTQDLAKRISSNRFVYSLIGSVLMVLLDLIIEVSAPRFDYWEFENGVPLQNYLGWFVIGFIAQLGYSLFKVDTDKDFSIHLLLAISIFFSAFLIF